MARERRAMVARAILLEVTLLVPADLPAPALQSRLEARAEEMFCLMGAGFEDLEFRVGPAASL